MSLMMKKHSVLNTFQWSNTELWFQKHKSAKKRVNCRPFQVLKQNAKIIEYCFEHLCWY